MDFGEFSFAAIWGGVVVVIAGLVYWQWKKKQNK